MKTSIWNPNFLGTLSASNLKKICVNLDKDFIAKMVAAAAKIGQIPELYRIICQGMASVCIEHHDHLKIQKWQYYFYYLLNF